MRCKDKKIVSILIPCYNGEKFIKRCCQCLYDQTYENLQIIFVDDGSTDNTKQLFFQQRKDLEEKGYEVIYKYKENGGAASAINDALKLVTGEYLALYDVDDFLMATAIEKKVDFLEDNPEYVMVRNNGYYVLEGEENKPIGLMIETEVDKNNENIFKALLLGNTTNLPGNFLVRTNILFENIKDKSIYVSQYGQNLQILMPVAYAGKCGYIDEVLMCYVKRSYSHSYAFNKERRYQLLEGYKHNRIEIIKAMSLPDDEKEEYLELIRKSYYKHFFTAAASYKDIERMKIEFANMKRNKMIELDDIATYYLQICKPIGLLLCVLAKLKNRIGKI